MAEVEWVVQYRISDPYQYLFRVRNPDKTLRDMSESTMRQVVGNRTVDEVLTVGRVEIETKVVELLQALCYEYENGIRIDQVVLQDVNPPDQVKPSFNAVNEAQQERERLINEAKAEFNKVIPNARGEAKRTIQSAEGYAIARVNEAQGEVAAFNELYSEYVKAPQITKKRIYLETMKNVLPKLGDKIIVDETGQGVLPLLQMKTRNGGTQ
jgi:membrane protease subunit HflK